MSDVRKFGWNNQCSIAAWAFVSSQDVFQEMAATESDAASACNTEGHGGHPLTSGPTI